MKLVFLQRLRPVIAMCLALTMLIGMINGQGYLTFADEALTGMIYSEDHSMVTTRKEPSDSADKRNNLVYGKPVTVVEEVTDAEGEVWYKLTYDLKAGGTSWGYCRAENVLLDKDVKAYAFGTINATHVAVRNDAGSDGTTILFYLDTGTELELLDTTTVDGNLWYRIRYINGETSTIGWVYGKYVDLEQYNVEIDPAYVEELIAKGFPESYTYNLAVLHAMYPQWIFEPVMTGLDWNTVIEKETEKPINMVPTSSDDAKKSVASTEYDWTTNTWVIRDGDSWVAVHPEYLAYCMDPRNFLTEQYIFQFESLSYSELHTIEGVNAVIGGTFMATDVTDTDGTTLNYANAFMSIGKEVGVSPYHLASRVRQEQGRGKSSLISGTYPGYEGYFNYFNFGASGVTDKVVIENGLKYAKNKGWDTRYKSLLGGSQAIAQNYIARGQDTLYFQKFNVVWKDMLYGHQYMGNVTAAISEGKEIAEAYADKNQAFVFRIPVYENMPEKAVEFKVSGNRNNYLKDLSVSGLSLTPTFTGATTEYTLIVEEAISSITVNATPVVEAAEVSGTGTHKLAVGTNTIKILCESESGDVRTYTLTVVREGVEEPTEPEVPTESEEPTEPEVPTESEEPTEPEEPTESEEPTEPEIPTESEEPTETEEPTEPEEPTDPETPVEPEVPAEIRTDKYVLGTYLTGVEPGTTAADFLAGFTLIGGAEMKLLDKNGTENTGTVATGNVLNVYDEGTLIATHEIVIYGDVNGDGRINILDAIKLNRHTIGITPVSGCYLEAADASRDGRANILDSIVINRFTIGLVTINQK